MVVARQVQLRPRKSPVQARSTATLQAIFDATIQVLLKDGVQRLTTTRVAARAGVSVGTLYQYLPHKQALLFAVLEQHLERLGQAIEMACVQLQARPVAELAEGLAKAYLNAKFERIDASRALYKVSAEMGTDLVGAIAKRTDLAFTKTLSTATDVTFDNLPAISLTLRATLAGTVRAVIERGGGPADMKILRTQLPLLCRAYLLAVGRATSTKS